MREALDQIKEELGADAVIMSNKKVDGGVEITAAVDYDSQPAEAGVSVRPGRVLRRGGFVSCGTQFRQE